MWPDLVETVLPDWIKGEFGMEWEKKPYVQNVTKKPACKIRNKHGTISTIQLDSLKNEDEVEDRYKGKRYSMIFVNELSKFKKRKTFDTLKQCLRMLHLPEDAQTLLADTNPADEGEHSWIWELWYRDRLRAHDAPKAGEPDERELLQSLKLLEFTLDDNLAITPQKRAALMADFAHDPDLLARYYYGRWVEASADAIFHKNFRPLWHVLGEEETASNPDPEIMLPEENCIELLTGWDPGPRNSAVVIAEKIFPEQPEYKGLPAFKFLDEVVVIDGEFDFELYVQKVLEVMDFWEKRVPRRIRWMHWSDRSVFDMMDLESQKYYHQLIYEFSRGKVALRGAERSPGTLRAGVELMNRLLWENRIFLNRRMVHGIMMFKSIKRGTNQLQVIQKGSRHKHVFDAMRYLVQSELYDEMHRIMHARIGKVKQEENANGAVVAVGL